ncbi:MAG: hypothetical protein F6K09_32390 [Merismopedia sp. SIO2A8]|nr:hypothetical protein [Symploca sp. SIO2B6]NET53198.1 hypothetical protein [Merismopedia sp. SIO2A8]
MGRWGDGEIGRWGDREMGRWGEIILLGGGVSTVFRELLALGLESGDTY